VRFIGPFGITTPTGSRPSIINLLLEKLYNGPARQADVIKKANQAFKAAEK
jgi:hypothetical protein